MEPWFSDTIRRVGQLIAAALLLTLGLTGFTFINYSTLKEAEIDYRFYCGVTTEETNTFFPADNPALKELPGYALFKDWACNTCHAIDHNLVGPALNGLSDRRSRDWIIKMIRNSSALISSGDPEAVTIFEKFDRLQMPPHDLSEEEIDQILDYINQASQ